MDEAKPYEPDMSFDDGHWYAATMGHFISLLVDAGHDPAVCFRVVEDYDHDEEAGTFIRKLEVIMVPDGRVVEAVKNSHGIHKTLSSLIKAGVVK
jgi:hypothetical protein